MSVELGMANQFILDLSKDVKRGMDSKVKKGWRPGIAPLGYLNDKAGEKGEKKILVVKLRFPIIRKMWDLLLSGNYTVGDVIKKANDDWGLRTIGYKRKASSKLALSTGYKIFVNPFYCGEFSWSGEIYEGKHKAMITKDEFDKVQMILGKKGKPRSKTKRLPFNGIITCGDCGGMFTADEKQKKIKSTGQIKSYIYHRCNKRKKDKPCYQKPIKSEDLTEQIAEYLNNISIPQEYLDWAIKAINESQEKEASSRDVVLENLQKNHSDCVNKINVLIQNFISPANQDRSLISDDELKEQKAILQEEKMKVKAKLDNLDKDFDEWVELTENSFKFATYSKYWFENGDLETKNNILKTLGSNFVLKDGKLSVHLQKPFEIIQNTFNLNASENALLEPSKVLINKGQNAPCRDAFPVMSREWGSNPRPMRYECIALPAELSRQYGDFLILFIYIL